jgi:hypothetical protein
VAALAALLFSLAAAEQRDPDSPVESIRLAELQEKVAHLSSPEMKGRGNGSPELRIAAEYIARAFQRSGLQPSGGSYFQDFEMFTARLGSRNQLLVNGRELDLEADYVPHYLSPTGEVRAPLVFVGYGVTARHLGFDELAGVDLKGRIAVAIDGNPRGGDETSAFNRIHPSDPGSVQTKARAVHERGAAGLILIQDPNGLSYSIGEIAYMFDPRYSRRFVPMGSTSSVSNPKLPVVFVSWESGRSMVSDLAGRKQRIDETLKPQSAELGVQVSLAVDVARLSFRTQNVVAVIPGTDPQLRGEALVIGAHYDHDGESEGRVWPGADDNASGVAGLLELAEAFGNGRSGPRRSIILSAFAGEEKGQVGSEHFVTNAPVAVDQIAGMIQLDMIGRNEEHGANRRRGLERETSSGNANSVNVIGSTYSPDLRAHVEAANKPVGLDLKFRYDDTPERLLQRSDQWPFLKRGIPALFIHTGEHPDYHQPTDTADKINYPKLERIVKTVYHLAERVANSQSRPRYVQP